MVKNNNLQSIHIGKNSTEQKLSESDNDVDSISNMVGIILNEHGFELSHMSNSYGLSPFTGHTKNSNYHLLQNKDIVCAVIISKHEFTIFFNEIELAPKSNNYSTTDSDLHIIKTLIIELINFASREYPGQSIQVSSYFHEAR